MDASVIENYSGRNFKVWRGKVPIIVGLIFGLAVSAILFVVSEKHFEREFTQHKLNVEAAPHSTVLGEIIQRSIEMTHAVAGLYAASNTVDQGEFHQYYLRVMGRETAMQAISWIPRVQARDRAIYEARARKDGHAGFSFTERDSAGNIAPAGNRDEFYPVYFIEPFEGNETAMGYDLGSNPERLSALIQARDSGHAVATQGISLVQENNRQKGFLVFEPIYENGVVPITVEERRKQHLGFASGVFRIGDLLDSSLQDSMGAQQFDIYIFDASAEPGGRLLHFRPSDSQTTPSNSMLEEEILSDSRAFYSASYVVGGRNWNVVYRLPSGDGVSGHLSATPWVVLLLSLLFTIMLVLYLRVTLNRTKLTESLFAERSKELLQINQALETEVAERKRVEQQFSQAQKMDAIGQLTGGIAHDFNNLLMVIGGYARRTLSNLDNLEVAGRSLEEVLAATEKATRLTKQLLMFSRRQVMEKRVFRIGDVIADLKGLLLHSVGEWYEIAYEVEDKNICVSTDPGELTQAILNLAINARDAMPKGGKVGISARVVELDQAFASSHPDLSAGTYVKISVTDQGTGIDEETLPHIFEPFFTTKEQGKGTGLGLAMVYGFARQSGGGADVSTSLGEGTEFSIYLPVVDRPAEPIIPDDALEYQGKGETVLLVEDDERLLELTHDILRDLGYKVLIAGNGLEALEIDDEMENGPDILVSDVIMPSLGGFELYEILRERRTNMKALFMSGYPQRGSGKVEIPENVPFLQKPVEAGQLARAIRKELDSAAVRALN